MVLAVEESVEYVAKGADMVEVVQDDHSGELCVRLLGVALLCQVGQVLPQVLGGKRQNKMMHQSEHDGGLLFKQYATFFPPSF